MSTNIPSTGTPAFGLRARGRPTTAAATTDPSTLTNQKKRFTNIVDDMDENALCPPALSPYALCVLDDKRKSGNEVPKTERTSSALGELTASRANTITSHTQSSSTLKPTTTTPSTSRHSKFMRKLGLGAPRRLTDDGFKSFTPTSESKNNDGEIPRKHNDQQQQQQQQHLPQAGETSRISSATLIQQHTQLKECVQAPLHINSLESLTHTIETHRDTNFRVTRELPTPQRISTKSQREERKHSLSRTPNKYSPLQKRHSITFNTTQNSASNRSETQKTPTKGIGIDKQVDSPELGRRATTNVSTDNGAMSSPRGMTSQYSQLYNTNQQVKYALNLEMPTAKVSNDIDTNIDPFPDTSSKFDHIQSLLEKKKEIYQLRKEIKQYKEELNNQRRENLENRKHYESFKRTESLGESDQKTLQINKHTFKVIEQIGKGGSSKVYKGSSADSPNRYFAIKVVSLEDQETSTIEELKGEIKILHKLRHCPRVVRLLDYSLSSTYIHFVMECGELDLATVLSTRHTMPQYYDLEFIRYHSLEMIKCINTIHQMDIVHLDLKPANFVFVSGVLKLIDFGISNSIKSHTVNVYREFQMGTPNYMAPETLIDFAENENGSTIWKVGKPADIWSLGCILYQITYGITPYAIYTGTKKILAITNPTVSINYPTDAVNLRKKNKEVKSNMVPSSQTDVPESVEKVCPYLIDMIKKCLIRDPSKRITSAELSNHIFVKPVIVDKTVVNEVVKGCVGFGSRHPEMKNVALGTTKNDISKEDMRAYERLDRLVDGVWKRVSGDKIE